MQQITVVCRVTNARIGNVVEDEKKGGAARLPLAMDEHLLRTFRSCAKGVVLGLWESDVVRVLPCRHT